MRISAVILAAGESARFGDNKLFVCLDEPLLIKVVRVFSNVRAVDELVLVVNEADEQKVNETLTKYDLYAKVVLGGSSREESAYIGVKASEGNYVLIHDAARANVSEKTIIDVINALENADGVIPVVEEPNSIINENGVYIERKSVFQVQTPQGFNKEKMLFSYEHAKKPLSSYTDDGSIYAENFPLNTIKGDPANKKITYAEDVYGLAGELIYGTGYDCHKLVEGRKLILGGVTIPHEKGLEGVSDADVVLHALMDAMLSACALGDIGKYFPPSDPKYIGANSAALTLKILKTVREAGYRPNNVAVTILAEKPKLADKIPLIRSNIAALCGLPLRAVGVGATTTEGIGLIGREEGIACHAICSLRKI